MTYQSLEDFSLLQKILTQGGKGMCEKEIDAIIENPVALSAIFTLASYLKVDLADKELNSLDLNKLSDKEFMRYYLIGLSIVMLELKTHNCCNIQHKFMKLYSHVLSESAKKNDYSFIEEVIKS
jgi:hypothetical protein